jgi:flagellin-specific chaperone FliS
LNQALEACLSQAPIKHQLDEVSACVQQLKAYRDEVPDEMDQLQKIANILASAEEHLSPEHELELSERLLTIYISVSDGALIF